MSASFQPKMGIFIFADHKQSLEEEIRRLGGKSEAIDKQKENAIEAPRKVLVPSLNVTRCNKATQTFHPGYFVSGNDGKGNKFHTYY